jgi:hypothetical protein
MRGGRPRRLAGWALPGHLRVQPRRLVRQRRAVTRGAILRTFGGGAAAAAHGAASTRGRASGSSGCSRRAEISGCGEVP